MISDSQLQESSAAASGEAEAPEEFAVEGAAAAGEGEEAARGGREDAGGAGGSDPGDECWFQDAEENGV